jgi:hypothetical protein
MAGYFQTSRRPTYSLLFALPLIVLYELGAGLISGDHAGLRNGADVLLRTLLATTGLHGTLALTAILALGAAVLIVMDRRKNPGKLDTGIFAKMTGESVIYAILFGFVVSFFTSLLLGQVRLAADGGAMARLPLTDAIVLSLGAGIYEELVFRVLITGGLLALFLALGAKRKWAGICAAVLAALLFSAFHYIGPYAYPLELQSFTFRFLAGLAFSGLYIVRGFGIAAWTHALYDVFLVVMGAGRG